MKCPRCKLENPPGSLVCDCGHRFPGGEGVKLTSYSIRQRDVEEIKRLGIANFHSIAPADLDHELSTGGKFVVFDYCVSFLVLTLSRSSSVYFIPSQQSALPHGLKYILLSLVLGWWGIPWGPIRTLMSLTTNFRGGRNITDEILRGVRRGA
jgi:hypothetical protein